MIEKEKKPIKEDRLLNITKESISQYLLEVFAAIKAGKYQISARNKNLELFMNYIFTEQDAKEVLLSLTVQDFSEAVYNEHSDYAEEILYIFGKEVSLVSRYSGKEEVVALYIKFNKLDSHYVIVISFHKQKYPMKYMFR